MTKEQIELYLREISALYGNDYPFLKGLTMSQAYTILCIPDPSNMEMKAQAQILSLVLTSRLRAPDFGDSYVWLQNIGQGSTYGGSGSGAIIYILELYEDGLFSAAKDLADGMNNAEACVYWGTYWGGCDGSSYALTSSSSDHCSGCSGGYSSGCTGTYGTCFGSEHTGCDIERMIRHEYMFFGSVTIELTMENGFVYPINFGEHGEVCFH